MLAHYEDYAAEMGVLDMPDGYNSVKQIGKNDVKRMFAHHGKFILLIGFGLLALLIGFFRWRRKRVWDVEILIMDHAGVDYAALDKAVDSAFTEDSRHVDDIKSTWGWPFRLKFLISRDF